jgi:hypothetical protein
MVTERTFPIKFLHAAKPNIIKIYNLIKPLARSKGRFYSPEKTIASSCSGVAVGQKADRRE